MKLLPKNFKVKLGLEVLLEDTSFYAGSKVGLLTNHTGLTNNLKQNIDLIQASKDLSLKRLFSPEHGIRGQAGAEENIGDMVDPISGLPVVSLFGERKKPPVEMLKDLDILFYDIQDLGLRYYTYSSTLLLAIESCYQADTKLIVLDRPNPLGSQISGNIGSNNYSSFIGPDNLPYCYGLTSGELALWYQKYYLNQADVEVIPSEGYSGKPYSSDDYRWVPTSPAIPSARIAQLYPYTCHLDSVGLDNGVGTANPFEYFGAPWLNPVKLIEKLETYELKGLNWRPVYYRKASKGFESSEMQGLHLYLDNPESASVEGFNLAILEIIFKDYPEKVNWKIWSEKEDYFFDYFMKTAEVRKDLLAGRSVEEILLEWSEERKDFTEEVEKIRLY